MISFRKLARLPKKGPQLGTERVVKRRKYLLSGNRLLIPVNWYPKSWPVNPYHGLLNEQEKDKQHAQCKRDVFTKGRGRMNHDFYHSHTGGP